MSGKYTLKLSSKPGVMTYSQSQTNSNVLENLPKATSIGCPIAPRPTISEGLYVQNCTLLSVEFVQGPVPANQVAQGTSNNDKQIQNQAVTIIPNSNTHKLKEALEMASQRKKHVANQTERVTPRGNKRRSNLIKVVFPGKHRPGQAVKATSNNDQHIEAKGLNKFKSVTSIEQRQEGDLVTSQKQPRSETYEKNALLTSKVQLDSESCENNSNSIKNLESALKNAGPCKATPPGLVNIITNKAGLDSPVLKKVQLISTQTVAALNGNLTKGGKGPRQAVHSRAINLIKYVKPSSKIAVISPVTSEKKSHAATVLQPDMPPSKVSCLAVNQNVEKTLEMREDISRPIGHGHTILGNKSQGVSEDISRPIEHGHTILGNKSLGVSEDISRPIEHGHTILGNITNSARALDTSTQKDEAMLKPGTEPSLNVEKDTLQVGITSDFIAPDKSINSASKPCSELAGVAEIATIRPMGHSGAACHEPTEHINNSNLCSELIGVVEKTSDDQRHGDLVSIVDQESDEEYCPEVISSDDDITDEECVTSSELQNLDLEIDMRLSPPKLQRSTRSELRKRRSAALTLPYSDDIDFSDTDSLPNEKLQPGGIFCNMGKDTMQAKITSWLIAPDKSNYCASKSSSESAEVVEIASGNKGPVAHSCVGLINNSSSNPCSDSAEGLEKTSDELGHSDMLTSSKPICGEKNVSEFEVESGEKSGKATELLNATSIGQKCQGNQPGLNAGKHLSHAKQATPSTAVNERISLVLKPCSEVVEKSTEHLLDGEGKDANCESTRSSKNSTKLPGAVAPVENSSDTKAELIASNELRHGTLFCNTLEKNAQQEVIAELSAPRENFKHVSKSRTEVTEGVENIRPGRDLGSPTEYIAASSESNAGQVIELTEHTIPGGVLDNAVNNEVLCCGPTVNQRCHNSNSCSLSTKVVDMPKNMQPGLVSDNPTEYNGTCCELTEGQKHSASNPRSKSNHVADMPENIGPPNVLDNAAVYKGTVYQPTINQNHSAPNSQSESTEVVDNTSENIQPVCLLDGSKEDNGELYPEPTVRILSSTSKCPEFNVVLDISNKDLRPEPQLAIAHNGAHSVQTSEKDSAEFAAAIVPDEKTSNMVAETPNTVAELANTTNTHQVLRQGSPDYAVGNAHTPLSERPLLLRIMRLLHEHTLRRSQLHGPCDRLCDNALFKPIAKRVFLHQPGRLIEKYSSQLRRNQEFTKRIDELYPVDGNEEQIIANHDPSIIHDKPPMVMVDANRPVPPPVLDLTTSSDGEGMLPHLDKVKGSNQENIDPKLDIKRGNLAQNLGNVPCNANPGNSPSPQTRSMRSTKKAHTTFLDGLRVEEGVRNDWKIMNPPKVCLARIDLNSPLKTTVSDMHSPERSLCEKDTNIKIAKPTTPKMFIKGVRSARVSHLDPFSFVSPAKRDGLITYVPNSDDEYCPGDISSDGDVTDDECVTLFQNNDIGIDMKLSPPDFQRSTRSERYRCRSAVVGLPISDDGDFSDPDSLPNVKLRLGGIFSNMCERYTPRRRFMQTSSFESNQNYHRRSVISLDSDTDASEHSDHATGRQSTTRYHNAKSNGCKGVTLTQNSNGGTLGPNITDDERITISSDGSIIDCDDDSSPELLDHNERTHACNNKKATKRNRGRSLLCHAPKRPRLESNSAPSQTQSAKALEKVNPNLGNNEESSTRGRGSTAPNSGLTSQSCLIEIEAKTQVYRLQTLCCEVLFRDELRRNKNREKKDKHKI